MAAKLILFLGYGTVDSGHLCLSGYNEVVIIRRLPKGHDRLAIQSDRNCFGEMPHSDMMVRTLVATPCLVHFQLNRLFSRKMLSVTGQRRMTSSG